MSWQPWAAASTQEPDPVPALLARLIDEVSSLRAEVASAATVDARGDDALASAIGGLTETVDPAPILDALDALTAQVGRLDLAPNITVTAPPAREVTRTLSGVTRDQQGHIVSATVKES